MKPKQNVADLHLNHKLINQLDWTLVFDERLNYWQQKVLYQRLMQFLKDPKQPHYLWFSPKMVCQFIINEIDQLIIIEVQNQDFDKLTKWYQQIAISVVTKIQYQSVDLTTYDFQSDFAQLFNSQYRFWLVEQIEWHHRGLVNKHRAQIWFEDNVLKIKIAFQPLFSIPIKSDFKINEPTTNTILKQVAIGIDKIAQQLKDVDPSVYQNQAQTTGVRQLIDWLDAYNPKESN